jgi:hypothetical protein
VIYSWSPWSKSGIRAVGLSRVEDAGRDAPDVGVKGSEGLLEISRMEENEIQLFGGLNDGGDGGGKFGA